MTLLTILLIGLFLPLFPLSMVFNRVFVLLPNPWLRSALLLVWPLIGLLIFYQLETQLPGWVTGWALVTALLYAFRLLTQREVIHWTGYFATAAWSLLWIPKVFADAELPLFYYALSFSIPLVLLVLLAQQLQQRFGAAYTGLYGGLAVTMPRFSGVLVFVLLAVSATPVFPAFFMMLKTLTYTQPLVAVPMATVWLLWSWASARLIQGLLIGPEPDERPSDLSQSLTWLYVVALFLFTVAGLYLTGGML